MNYAIYLAIETFSCLSDLYIIGRTSIIVATSNILVITKLMVLPHKYVNCYDDISNFKEKTIWHYPKTNTYIGLKSAPSVFASGK